MMMNERSALRVDPEKGENPGWSRQALWLLLILGLIWAGIYLPALGSTEIKGEEPRRILPAIRMVETGDWLSLYVGARPYMRKPPLINWAIAGAITVTGSMNEWVVRAPSALSVLALGLTVFGACRGWLGNRAAFLAALMVLTNISMMEKGRLAEIEPLYIACLGMALAFWLGAFGRGAGNWLLWVPAGVFLGLGMLAKGPLHLVYFYGITAGVLWRTGEMKRYMHPAHFVAIALTFAPLLLWAQLFQAAMPAEAAEEAGGVWLDQLLSRLGLDDFSWNNWLMNIPRGILNLLPWCLFFPLLWSRDLLEGLGDRDRGIVEGSRRLVVILFVVISLIPGSVERYTLPLLTPVFILLAPVILRAGQSWLTPWRWSLAVLLGVAALGFVGLPFAGSQVLGQAWWWLGLAGTVLFLAISCRNKQLLGWNVFPLGLATGALCVLVTAGYAALTPVLREHEDARPMAEKIEKTIPSGVPLYVQDSGFRQFWYYLEPEAQFFWGHSEMRWDEAEEPSISLLLPRDKAERFVKIIGGPDRPGVERTLILEVQDRRGDEYELWLLQRDGAK